MPRADVSRRREMLEELRAVLVRLSLGEMLTTKEVYPSRYEAGRNRFLAALGRREHAGHVLLKEADPQPKKDFRHAAATYFVCPEQARPAVRALAEDDDEMKRLLWPLEEDPLSEAPRRLEAGTEEPSGYVGYGVGEEHEDPPEMEGPGTEEMMATVLRTQAAIMEQLVLLRRELAELRALWK